MNPDQKKSLEEFPEIKLPGLETAKGLGTPGGRQEHSLGVLTQKFIDLLHESDEKTIDLNYAVQVTLT